MICAFGMSKLEKKMQFCLHLCNSSFSHKWDVQKALKKLLCVNLTLGAVNKVILWHVLNYQQKHFFIWTPYAHTEIYIFSPQKFHPLKGFTWWKMLLTIIKLCVFSTSLLSCFNHTHKMFCSFLSFFLRQSGTPCLQYPCDQTRTQNILSL